MTWYDTNIGDCEMIIERMVMAIQGCSYEFHSIELRLPLHNQVLKLYYVVQAKKSGMILKGMKKSTRIDLVKNK